MASSESFNISMTDLSQEITTKVAELTSLLNSGSHPLPSLRADGPSDYPNNGAIHSTRYAIIDAATALIHLAMGPREFMSMQSLCLKADSFVLGALHHWDIFNAVPIPPSAISYEDISKKISLSKDKTERIIKHAMTSKIFYEPEPGMVAHTANSIAPVRIPQLNAWIGFQREENEPAMLKLEDALERFGDSGLINETAFNLAHGKRPEDTFWSVLNGDGEGDRRGWRMKKFGMAMAIAGRRNPEPSRESPINVVFDWESLGEATVVDVGGGGGHLSVEIATFHPKLSFVVQDLPSQEAVFSAYVPSQLRSRISFQPHDSFTTQPVKEADVYLLSAVLHNWSDEMAVKILRQIAPAMKPSSRILVIEQVVAEFGDMSNAQMRATRSTDLVMLALFNSKERTKEDWKELAKSVDGRLVVKDIVRPSVGGSRSLVEVGFRDS